MLNFKKFLRYEPETGKFFWRLNRGRGGCGAKAGSEAGGVDGDGYIKIEINGKQYRAHRLAWFLIYGEMPYEQIDHINGDRADNRIVNLRQATSEENRRNYRTPSTNSTGFKGVTRFRGRFQAQIGHQGKNIYLGLFPTADEAHDAYCMAAREYHGEFARLK